MLKATHSVDIGELEFDGDATFFDGDDRPFIALIGQADIWILEVRARAQVPHLQARGDL